MPHHSRVKRVLFKEETEAAAASAEQENQLNELLCLRDQLKNDALAAAQNNLNSYMEMKELRTTMIQCMIEPLKLRRRVGRKLRQVKRLLAERQQVLENQLVQLKLLAREMHAESHLDWSLLQAGEFQSYEHFLDAFIEHRKGYHLHKSKANKLTIDVELLHDLVKFCREYPH